MNNEKRKKKKHKVWYTLTVNNDNSANYTANSKLVFRCVKIYFYADIRRPIMRVVGRQ